MMTLALMDAIFKGVKLFIQDPITYAVTKAVHFVEDHDIAVYFISRYAKFAAGVGFCAFDS